MNRAGSNKLCTGAGLGKNLEGGYTGDKGDIRGQCHIQNKNVLLPITSVSPHTFTCELCNRGKETSVPKNGIAQSFQWVLRSVEVRGGGLR